MYAAPPAALARRGPPNGESFDGDDGQRRHVFFVPAEVIHAVRNVGNGNAAELAE